MEDDKLTQNMESIRRECSKLLDTIREERLLQRCESVNRVIDNIVSTAIMCTLGREALHEVETKIGELY